MSSLVVKQWSERLVKAMVPSAPYQPTIGVLLEQKNLPEIWSTLEHADASNQRLTVGTSALWREFGNFTVILAGKAGFGPEPLEKLGQAFSDHAMPWQERLRDPISGRWGTLRIDNVSPPNSEPYEDGNWLMCSVVCVYTYDSVRGAGA